MSESALDQAKKQQARASQPEASAWVSANAGSGKTYVLVQRLVRLMLAGTLPERILCLTFTRTAAAEMEKRLFDRLSEWIVLSDDELRDRIGKMGIGEGWDGNLGLARRLFTRALETPGGLKIQTLHAFCQSVLQRFPVEAGVAPGFSVMDERTAAELMRSARERMLIPAAQGSAESPEAEALLRIVRHTQAPGFDEVLTTLLDQRSPLIAGWSIETAAFNPKARLYEELGLNEDESEDVVVSRALAGIDADSANAAVQAFAAGSGKTDRESANLLERALREDDWDAYRSVFLTAKGTARAAVATNSVKTKHPAAWQWLEREQSRVLAAEDRRKSAVTAEASHALFTLASLILLRFQGEKERRGELDYDDLIMYTRNLLARLDAAWVLYRLDGGIDHVLIDEAQDTSPEQWDIVGLLTGEFFAGEGAREVRRTMFAVGDHKQSIFSFQGAAPDEFEKQKHRLAGQAEDSGRPFEDVSVHISFRSTQTILDAVDRVFFNQLARKGLGEDGVIEHRANRQGQSGRVEIWPPVEKSEGEERDPYDPVDAPGADSPRLKLARHIAGVIKRWIDAKELLEPRGRPIEPGDVLILVRNRTVLADALVRSLRETGIPVAGADRLKINSHIAIMDLVALARCLHMPRDDYSLACVLKSPLIRHDEDRAVDDDDLTALAAKRKGALWRELARAPGFGRAAAQLKAWRGLAGRSRPFEFFSHVLEAEGARRRFAERLGPEVNDPLDELLSLAGEYERTHPPVLHGFVAWLTDADAEIKRDMEHGKNEVRVMTVHGAKGLEANIVILPDTTSRPSAGKVPDVLTFERGMPVWKLASARQPEAVAALVEADVARQSEEENRLLYVAMTRACDRLYVCGTRSRNELPPDCWYELIRQALEPHADEIETEDGTLLYLEGDQTEAPEEDGAAADESDGRTAVPSPADDWMFRPAPIEPPALRPLAPSRLELVETAEGVTVELKEPPAASPVARSGESSYARGRLIHRLLQSLPSLPDRQRRPAAVRFLNAYGHEIDRESHGSVIDEVFGLLDSADPALQAIFGPSGLSEVPVTAEIGVRDRHGRPIVVAGQIDRLALHENDVLIADFKTNRPPPESVDRVARIYIRQIAAYSMALKTVYPDRNVRAWLVWTFNASVMELSEDLLSGAFT